VGAQKRDKSVILFVEDDSCNKNNKKPPLSHGFSPCGFFQGLVLTKNICVYILGCPFISGYWL
jgi:hypothetical protein